MTAILPEPAPGFHWTPAPHAAWNGAVLRCRALDERADHFFTARPLRLRGDATIEIEDWDRVATAIGLPAGQLWRMRQVHGCTVASVPHAESAPAGSASTTHHARAPRARGPEPPEADALISADPSTALAVQVADCVPLLLADDGSRVAATHSGWRGAVANIAAATVRRLTAQYGASPRDLIAVIGPSIGPCCYQVGPEVRARFLRNGAALAQAEDWFRPDEGDRLKLDMWQVTRDQLIAAGLLPDHIHTAGLCTACHVGTFYSYRVEGASTGRLLGVIRGRPVLET